MFLAQTYTLLEVRNPVLTFIKKYIKLRPLDLASDCRNRICMSDDQIPRYQYTHSVFQNKCTELCESCDGEAESKALQCRCGVITSLRLKLNVLGLSYKISSYNPYTGCTYLRCGKYSGTDKALYDLNGNKQICEYASMQNMKIILDKNKKVNLRF